MKNILLTGRPGVGKTTVIREVLSRLEARVGGFYTEEIREGRARKGFKIASLDGEEGVLAHVDHRSRYRVSKYGVNLNDLERVGVAALLRAFQGCDLIVLDEIGKMETFSDKFRLMVLRCLDSEKHVLGTIQQRGSPFLDSIRRRPDVQIVEVTVNNRNHLPEEITGALIESKVQG